MRSFNPAPVVPLILALRLAVGAVSAAGEASAAPPPSGRECLVPLPFPFRAELPLNFSRPVRSPTGGGGRKGKVANVVHFIFGYDAGGSAAFTFINYAAVASALHVLQPDEVMVHCPSEPIGFLWDLVRPFVTVSRGRDVQTIFQNPVDDYAHKADVLRLEALLEYGGVYLDIDVVTLRPFGDLMDAETVIGQEGKGDGLGLCNGVILAAPNATFLQLWYEEYRTFDGSEWNYHSVLLPQKLAKAYPDLVSIQAFDAFHWPLWNEQGMQLMFDSFEYMYANNKAVHMWRHGLARSSYKDFGIPWCFECRSTLLSMLQAYVPDPLFSVIIPCFNQKRFISDALRSVVAQTFPSWEIVVVDDHSPDRCGAFVAAWARRTQHSSRIKVVRNSKVQGLAETRNIGVRTARGVWICALDADDKIGPDYFRAASMAMSHRPDLQLIYSDQQMFGESNTLWDVPHFTPSTATETGPLPAMSLYLRSIWGHVGGYSSSLPWGNEDYDFWLKLLEFGVESEKLHPSHVYYRFRTAGSMMRDGEAYRQEEWAMLHTRHPQLYPPARLLQDHRKVMAMADETRQRLLLLQSKPMISREDRAYGAFWLALQDLQRGEYGTATSRLANVTDVAALQWQAHLYLAVGTLRSGEAAVSSQLLRKLSEQYPDLGTTSAFRHYDAECRSFAESPPPPPRRDWAPLLPPLFSLLSSADPDRAASHRPRAGRILSASGSNTGGSGWTWQWTAGTWNSSNTTGSPANASTSSANMHTEPATNTTWTTAPTAPGESTTSSSVGASTTRSTSASTLAVPVATRRGITAAASTIRSTCVPLVAMVRLASTGLAW